MVEHSEWAATCPMVLYTKKHRTTNHSRNDSLPPAIRTFTGFRSRAGAAPDLHENRPLRSTHVLKPLNSRGTLVCSGEVLGAFQAGRPARPLGLQQCNTVRRKSKESSECRGPVTGRAAGQNESASLAAKRSIIHQLGFVCQSSTAGGNPAIAAPNVTRCNAKSKITLQALRPPAGMVEW
jgi:hypothetical protein